MKHIKLFRLFESELAENKVDISGLFSSPKWLALFEAIGVRREEMKDKEIPGFQKEQLERGVNVVLPADDTLTAIKLSQHEISQKTNSLVTFPGSDDFEHLKKFIVKPLRSWDTNSPAKFILDSTNVIVSGRDREVLSIRLLSRDSRRDIDKDLKGGFRSGVRFAKDLPSKNPEAVEGIVAEALINVSIKANRDYFAKDNSSRPETIEQFNLFCDIISGMIASACSRPDLGPDEDRRKEIHDIILKSGDHRVMNFAKKYYSDLWDEIQTATGGGAETLADLTELGF